jgi:uncharacterized tellurite resistance protein B-like protein
MIGILKMYPIEGATQKDAISYVSLLFSLANVDGVDEKESAAIKLLVSENGWSTEVYEEAKLNAGITIESLNLSPETIKVFGPYLIRDLCAIAHVSNGFSNQEDELINSIREKVGISSEKYSMIKIAVKAQLEAIENWGNVLSA